MTLLAFNFCDLELWQVILSWLLPFLLGLLAGYLWAKSIWEKYKKKSEDLETKVNNLGKTISGLEADLEACRHARAELDGDVALLKGQLREKNLEISTLESSLAASKKASSSSSIAAGAAGLAASSLTSGKKKEKTEKKAKKAAAAVGKKKQDDLKKIEGVGPKIAGLLNDAGINTFGDLAGTKQGKLRKILDDAGPRYKIANPGTWPKQAALARDGKWDELEKLQDYLDGGVEPTAVSASEKDDLKKVEGIGPKIEGLLNADGIMTFAQLAKSSVDRIQKILDAAGSRYRIANPETWPDQAALARDGKWDALEKLQDELKGGRKA